MINTVLLGADGSIFPHGGADGEVPPLRALSCRIALEEGYRLRSFFRMLDAAPVLTELNAFLPEICRRHRACPSADCKNGLIDRLEFGKMVEMIGFPGEPRLEVYTVFQGGLGAEAVNVKSFDIASLLDMPVVLGKLQHVIFGDRTDHFEFETVFTLFEFIDGIAWALSFHNAPEQCAIGR